MIANYAPNPPLQLLANKADFKTATAANWKNPRSGSLTTLGRALETFDVAPSAANFTLVQNALGTWLGAKAGRHDPLTGAITSVRTVGMTAFAQELARLNTLYQERDTAMQRIINFLDAVNWKSRALCAELYDDNLNLGGVDLHKVVLKNEAVYSSGWARLIPRPATIQFWDNGGAGEVARLAAWPTLSMAARLRFASDNGGVPIAWTPWPNGTHVRKGLFCHSAAALAVNVILANVAAIQAGLGQWRIRAIDVIHQRPAQAGGMTHWWVAINRPDNVVFRHRTHTFNGFADFSLLPMVGGFVVDLWGAMWVDQRHHQDTWSTDANNTPTQAVQLRPFITLTTNNDPITIYTHQIY